MLDNAAMVVPSDAEQKRQELRDFIEAKRLKVKPWAAKAGVSSGTIRNFLDGRSQTLTQATVDALAKAADVSAAEIFPSSYGGAKPLHEKISGDNHQSAVANQNQTGLALASGVPGFQEWPRTLEIKGHVKAGMEGFFLDQGETHGMAPRPPVLKGVRSAFAAYVRDDSMFPAYEPDDLVFVHPGMPVVAPCNVVIEMTDGQAFVKRLLRRTDKMVLCMQWNPKKEIKYDPKKVKSIYRILRPKEYGA